MRRPFLFQQARRKGALYGTDHSRGGLADCSAITRLNREEMGYDYPQERPLLSCRHAWQTPPIEFCGGMGERWWLPSPGRVRCALCRPHGECVGDRRLQCLAPPGGGQGPPVRRRSLGPFQRGSGSAPCLRRGQERRHAFYQNLGYTGNKLQRNFKKPL